MIVNLSAGCFCSLWDAAILWEINRRMPGFWPKAGRALEAMWIELAFQITLA
jgi:hypothetical protein